MYDARVVANEVLIRAWDEELELTQIDVQKICYFLHGHFLVEHGQPLISSEFEAWEYGPVQKTVHDAFKSFGDQPIDKLARKFDPVKREYKELPRLLDNSAIASIEEHLYKYLEIPSFTLVDITHAPNTPWSKTMDDAKTKTNIGMRIKNDVISSNFEGLIHA
ncbi:Panacea domain-containing protein [Roseibium sp. MMSF_3412]|uniref:Panacea domain-containing protein n=1 Tax=Roseibium sp. MMSF_3412 TaxID=3046712 RepID=UPI00273F1338|nr:type II toxin-antitoxin system antitoxin SocA domain-containing protein [Roseibium sp. MMSF_3412]